MRCLLPVALLGLSASVHATPTVILEDVQGTPLGWSFRGYAGPSDKITLFVALKEPGIQELKAKLHQRQNPDHPEFGQHLSRGEVLQHRQPADAAARAVSAWLKSSGIRDVHNQGSLLSFEATAQTVKSMLQADLAYYAYNGSDAPPVLRAKSYTIPVALRDYIDFPKPTSHAPTPTSHSTSRRPTSTPTPIGVPGNENPSPNLPCLAATVPDCIKQLYNITYTPPSTPPSPVRLGIAGFLEQWVLYSDVAEFLGRYAPSLLGSSTTTTNTTTPSSAAANFTIEPLNNGTNPQSPPSVAGLEASLDVQYALALGYPAQVTYYSTGGRGIKLDPATGRPWCSAANDNEPYLEFLTALLARPDDALPHVLSISYADDEASVPRAYARRVCDLFAALAARGVSVLVATGDGGAAGTGQTQCVVAASAAAAGGGGVDDEGTTKRFVPTFPGSCPYVTAVGATDNVGPPVAG
ncbi:uncharacterized protein THITE_2025173, partial [Thermothielavioides terrestris NRRL 8126]